MKGSYREVPEFSIPSKENSFLKSSENHYLYEDLYIFTGELKRIKNESGWKDDDLILILAHSSDQLVLLIAAAFLLEIPILPLHPESTDREIQLVLETIKPVAVYTDQQRDLDVFRELPRIEFGKSVQQDFIVETELSFGNPEGYAGCFLTSGSTGKPKIVPIKRRQVLFSADSSARNFRPAPNHYWLLCLPLNHAGGINVIYRSLLYGSAVYLSSGFDAETIQNLLNENKKFEAASMVPTMLEKLLEAKFFRLQFNFKGLLIGGGPISQNLINRALTRGIPIVTSYGMTETCAQIAANPMLRSGGMYIPKQSVGMVFHPNEVEIRDENENKLPLNEQGQIWLRGPQIFDGYTDEELNRTVFDADGWFNTGDYGHLNRKKQLFIESRRTDLIITGGENVNPAEIEELLKSIPEITDAAVFGIPDKIWGQQVTAFYTTETEGISSQYLKSELSKHVQSFKIPKEFIRADAIPRNTMQKIIRNELSGLYQKLRRNT
ncbi:MAG: AMP-binding protein [Balneolaceae bacterium]|nr:AMP-binding protein [Balneolaceae bacterium]